MDRECSRCDVPSRGQSVGLQWLIRHDRRNRAETYALLSRRPNSFDGVGGLNVKIGPDILVGLNVLGSCNIIRSANVLGGLGVPDGLDLCSDPDMPDGREVLVSKCLTMTLRCSTTVSRCSTTVSRCSTTVSKIYDQLLPNGLADPLGIELLEL